MSPLATNELLLSLSGKVDKLIELTAETKTRVDWVQQSVDELTKEMNRQKDFCRATTLQQEKSLQTVKVRTKVLWTALGGLLTGSGALISRLFGS